MRPFPEITGSPSLPVSMAPGPPQGFDALGLWRFQGI